MVSRFAYLDSSTPLAFAHRGGAFHPDNIGHENTMRAFAQAVELGYRYVETDVHATRDGVLLAFHDDGLDRVTDGRGVIRELTFSEVRKAKVGGSEPIPVFAEVLEQFPDTRFNIDVKAMNAVEPLVDLVNSTGALNRICVASFSHRRVHAVRRALGPDLCTALSTSEVATMRLAPPPTHRVLRGGCLQIPVRAGRIELVTPRLIRDAHRRGMQVHVWTIDDRDEMIRLLDLGVDGLVTDRTDILRELLIERGQW